MLPYKCHKLSPIPGLGVVAKCNSTDRGECAGFERSSFVASCSALAVTVCGGDGGGVNYLFKLHHETMPPHFCKQNMREDFRTPFRR